MHFGAFVLVSNITKRPSFQICIVRHLSKSHQSEDKTNHHRLVDSKFFESAARRLDELKKLNRWKKNMAIVSLGLIGFAGI